VRKHTLRRHYAGPDKPFYVCYCTERGQTSAHGRWRYGYFPAHVNKELAGMNKDQVKGVAKIVAGKVQEEAGILIGSQEQFVKGVKKQMAGRAQKGRGDVRETIKDFNKDHPK